MISKVFINWSKETFICHWDGVPYTFHPGQSIYLEDWKADHFAKHLTDREMQRDGLVVNDFHRDEYLKKCFVEEESVEVNPKNAEAEILNKNIEAEKIEAPKKGRPKKVAEEEFEGLK